MQNLELPEQEHEKRMKRILEGECRAAINTVGLEPSVGFLHEREKERFIDLLRERFNSAVRYKGRAFKWDIVIEQKAIELCRYLAGPTGRPDFSEPSPTLHRMDDPELRRQILGLSQSEALRHRIGKSTLHYLRRTARSDRAFRISRKVREKLLRT